MIGLPKVVDSASQQFWDTEFKQDQYVYGTEPNDFLKSHFSAIPRGKVLCLADGEGRNSVFLAKQGYAVTGVDISQVALSKAQKLAKANGVEVSFVFADLSSYELGEQHWDGIVSISCHLPSEMRKALHQRVFRALKPEGVFLFEGYTPSQLAHGTGGPPAADMLTTKETLASELPEMVFQRLEELERTVVEGLNHTGLGAVVQAIGSPR